MCLRKACLDSLVWASSLLFHFPFFSPSCLKWFAEWQINTTCFYRCKTNRSHAGLCLSLWMGLCYVWRRPLHHLHLQTLCNLNLFVAFMLYCPPPPKVKERDLDLKHKSSLQALELSLPLNAADQCPFLLKIKPFEPWKPSTVELCLSATWGNGQKRAHFSLSACIRGPRVQSNAINLIGASSGDKLCWFTLQCSRDSSNAGEEGRYTSWSLLKEGNSIGKGAHLIYHCQSRCKV